MNKDSQNILDDNNDGLIDYSSTYKLLKEGESIDLTNSRGRSISDQTSIFWDITQAFAAETSFQVLLEGEENQAGRYKVWSTDGSGVIINRGRWMTGDQMERGRYEDVFKRDLNNDGFAAIESSSLL